MTQSKMTQSKMTHPIAKTRLNSYCIKMNHPAALIALALATTTFTACQAPIAETETGTAQTETQATNQGFTQVGTGPCALTEPRQDPTFHEFCLLFTTPSQSNYIMSLFFDLELPTEIQFYVGLFDLNYNLVAETPQVYKFEAFNLIGDNGFTQSAMLFKGGAAITLTIFRDGLPMETHTAATGSSSIVFGNH